MPDAPDLAFVAALIGEPARARMLALLMGGAAFTATELAAEADVAPSTASAHLGKLTRAKILAVERQGRHRYFRLFDTDVAHALETLMGVSAGRQPRHRPGPADAELRAARVCYDHLAGERGVWLLEQLRRRRVLPRDGDDVSRAAEAFFAGVGIDLRPLTRSRRPLCRWCLDWSERRHHLGGALGAAILEHIFARRWARREPDGRAVLFTPAGERSLQRAFGAPETVGA